MLSLNVAWKDLFAVFKVMVTWKAHNYNQNMTFYYFFWTTGSFATAFTYIIRNQSVLWKDWSAVFKVKVTLKTQNFIVSDDLFWTAESSLTKLGIVTHHHEPECFAKRLVCYLRGRGHIEGSNNQAWKPYLLDYRSFCNQNIIGWYIIISWSVLCKDWIAVVKVKVTVKVQNFIESLSILYFPTNDIWVCCCTTAKNHAKYKQRGLKRTATRWRLTVSLGTQGAVSYTHLTLPTRRTV